MKNKNIVVGINASYLRKTNTGIGQVTLNFLRKLSELKVKIKLPVGKSVKPKEIEFILYLEEDISRDFKFLKSFTKKIFLPTWKRDDLIRKIWWEKFLLPKKIKEDKCDFFISLYQCPTDLGKTTKHIMLVHDIIPKIFPQYLNNSRKKFYWNFTEKAIKNSDKIITVSKRTEKDLIKYLRIEADKITTNYIDVDDIYKKSISQKENSRVLKKYKLKPGYIFAGGGYEIRKNVEGLVRAYKMLLDKNKSAHFLKEIPKLVIYGKILPKNLALATNIEDLLKELNLTKKVDLLGEVPQKDLPTLFNNASIFVYPSFYEGFGMQILEAMNVGVPVVTSKNSSLPEVGGDSVLYCNPNEFSDIAMVMKNVLMNKNLRDTLKVRGQERARQFSWEKFSEKILNIIRTYENTK
jgi:glycosyltransferase involved in cell wall biosynthesis